MNLRISSIVLSALLLATGSSVTAQKVTTDYDKNADFSHYKTYMWAREPNLKNPLMRDRVRDDINAELNAKGWQMVSDNGDVAIVANGATQEQQTLQTFYDGFPGWRWYWGPTATTTVERYTVGTLVVDLFDAHTKQAIFRGTASGTLSDEPERNEEKLKKAVEKIFKKFPPGGRD
jgi:hypothetical protein